MVQRSQFLSYLTSILIWLSYTNCERMLSNARNFISFNDVFNVDDSDMFSKSKKRCDNFAEVLFDDSKLEVFNGEILGFIPGSRKEMLIRKSPSALRCEMGFGGSRGFPQSITNESAAPCLHGCIEMSYVVLDENRSRAIFINTIIENDLLLSTATQGQDRQPLAASIVVRTTSNSRNEAITRAIQQLRRRRSISDIFIDRSSTVVRNLGSRRFRVILKFERFVWNDSLLSFILSFITFYIITRRPLAFMLGTIYTVMS